MESKLRHEAFVSNNNGTSILEINLVTLCPNLSLLAYLLISPLLPVSQRPGLNFLTQFTIIILPSLLSTTIFSDHLISLSSFLLLISFIASILHSFGRGGMMVKGGEIMVKKGGKMESEVGEGEKVVRGVGDDDSLRNKWPSALQSASSPPPSLSPSLSSPPPSLSPTLNDDKLLAFEKTSKIPSLPNEGLKHRKQPATSQPINSTDGLYRPTRIDGLYRPTKINGFYRPSFLSNARAYVLIQSAISILGIDFPLYPRRFGKTETTGFGLMDAGVGLFIVCNSVIDPAIKSGFNDCGYADWKRAIRTFLKSSFSSWPLLLCFLLRLTSLRAIDYQQHTSEYGVHWNFFLTLCCLKIIASTLNSIITPNCNLVFAIIISISYEIYLEHFKFREYILSPGPRHNIIDMNKEGIYSLLGNYTLYVYALVLGRLLYHHHVQYTNTSELRNKSILFLKLLSVSLSLWVSVYLYLWVGFEVSRRMANVGYVLWVLAICSSVLGCSCLVEVLASLLIQKASSGFEPAILSSTTYNSFFYFILANLATGMVNMTFDTMTTKNTSAMAILVMYLLGFHCVFSALYSYKIRLKFW